MTNNKDSLWGYTEGSLIISEEEIERDKKLMDQVRKIADYRARMAISQLAKAYGTIQPLGRCLGKSVLPKIAGLDSGALMVHDEMTDIPDNVFGRPSSSAPPMHHLPPQSEIGKAIDKHLKSNLVDVTVECDYQRYERDWSLEAFTYGIRSVKGNINPPPEVLPVVHMEEHKKALCRIDLLEKQMAQLTEKVSVLTVKSEPAVEAKKENYWR